MRHFPLGSTLMVALTFLASPALALKGAIFTTTVDGGIVNENVHYEAKEDVYLDGGPGQNAPASAASLPAGDYYFQVTDPSGKDLLSTDHISCRRVHINDAGVIDELVAGGMNYERMHVGPGPKQWAGVPCSGHLTGIDADHNNEGAITVQLFPYDDTPNPGGVYKAWVTPVDAYALDPAAFVPAPDDSKDFPVNGELWQPGFFHGFIPSESKTDNYKVKEPGKPFDPPLLRVRKFHDRNADGVQDAGEEDVTGWMVTITDPGGTPNDEFTPVEVLTADPGDYSVVEDTPAGTLQTAAFLDGLALAVDPTVTVPVAGDSGEIHEVVYGNVALGSVQACKFYDPDGMGDVDPSDPPVEGWRMELTGTEAGGAPVGPIVQETDASGCTTFAGLLPGDYTVTEIIPTTGGWQSTGPEFIDLTIESSLDGMGSTVPTLTVSFTNVCFDIADFDTKGYWHNKNGLTELTPGDIDHVNGLLPYSAPSSYFGDGDEPFDGLFSNGDLVAAAMGDGIFQGVAVAPEGSANAEVSQFLVDPNAGGDPREQLAQQLLAFIFNSRHRLDDPGAVIELPDGSLMSASELIDWAIITWTSGTPEEQNAKAGLLDQLNNDDAVPFVNFFPCEVVYP